MKDINKQIFPPIIIISLVCATLLFVWLSKRCFSGYSSLRLPAISTGVDKPEQNPPSRKRYPKWVLTAVDKIESAGISDAVAIINRIESTQSYDGGAVAELVAMQLGIECPDMEGVKNTARQRVSPETLKKSITIAQSNRIAIYFALPIIKDSVINELKKIYQL